MVHISYVHLYKSLYIYKYIFMLIELTWVWDMRLAVAVANLNAAVGRVKWTELGTLRTEHGLFSTCFFFIAVNNMDTLYLKRG